VPDAAEEATDGVSYEMESDIEILENPDLRYRFRPVPRIALLGRT